MIVRRHEGAGTRSEAVYSACECYRYLLSRDWGGGGQLLYILLNPSTASEERNDPTVERCERRARRGGYGGFAVVNLFAFRATDPRDLKRAADPVGARNDGVILDAAARAARVLCGWGVHGAHQGRAARVLRLLSQRECALWHLGLTKAGHPRHPLYLPYDRQAQRFATGNARQNAGN